MSKSSLSLADNDELIISDRHMAGAIESIKWIDAGLSNVFSGHGNSATAEDAARIFREIQKACSRGLGYAKYPDLVKSNYRHLNSQEMDIVLATLLNAGAIDEVIIRDPKTEKVIKIFRVLDQNFINQLNDKTLKGKYNYD